MQTAAAVGTPARACACSAAFLHHACPSVCLSWGLSVCLSVYLSPLQPRPTSSAMDMHTEFDEARATLVAPLRAVRGAVKAEATSLTARATVQAAKVLMVSFVVRSMISYTSCVVAVGWGQNRKHECRRRV